MTDRRDTVLVADLADLTLYITGQHPALEPEYHTTAGFERHIDAAARRAANPPTG